MNKLTQKEKFDLANDLDFTVAIMDAEDGKAPLQRQSFKNIGDRIRLIEQLENKGFKIIKIKST